MQITEQTKTIAGTGSAMQLTRVSEIKLDIQPFPSKTVLGGIFLGVLVLELLAGFYFGVTLGRVMGDALARTANGFYVLFIDPPRFASMGLVWNPLPSTLQLPFIALWPLWPQVVTAGLAASIITALSQAAMVTGLFAYLVRYNLDRFWSAVLTLVFAVSPYAFLYGFNGLSETPYYLFAMLVVLQFMLWTLDFKTNRLVIVAVCLVLAFFTRYETIALAGSLFLVLVVFLYSQYLQQSNVFTLTLKKTYGYFEGTAILLFTPLAYAILLWLIYNWAITGNPMYFWNSLYSNKAATEILQAGGGNSQYIGNVGASLAHIFPRAIQFFIPLIPIFIMRVINRRLFKADFLILLTFIGGTLAMHFFMLITGSSYGWVRFYSYAYYTTLAFVPYEMYLLSKESQRKILAFTMAIALGISGIMSYFVMNDASLSPEEYEYLAIDKRSAKDTAHYINENIASDAKILMDSYTTAEIIINLEPDRIHNLITSASLDFEAAIASPWAYVEYIAIPAPEGNNILDAFHLRYSGLYEQDPDWGETVVNFGNFKLLRVLPQ